MMGVTARLSRLAPGTVPFLGGAADASLGDRRGPLLGGGTLSTASAPGCDRPPRRTGSPADSPAEGAVELLGGP